MVEVVVAAVQSVPSKFVVAVQHNARITRFALPLTPQPKYSHLPAEVQRAASLLLSVGADKWITDVVTIDDPIVFSQLSHTEFASKVIGRKIQNVGRYGKYLYIELDGDGPMPVLHFGMTGLFQIKGENPTYYRKKPKNASVEWPPKFMKFVLHLTAEDSKLVTEVAFLDARRLGRVRLCASPLDEPPISTLGFDPILSMPALDEFMPLVRKRLCPIKALLLDQSFSAGVGNWVADEILYNARIHPEQRCNTLTQDQIVSLRTQMIYVCETAVAVNADSEQFPIHWLFKHRWGKKKEESDIMTLPNGKPATIKWITVGGRTSAYVVEMQLLPSVGDTRQVSKLFRFSGHPYRHKLDWGTGIEHHFKEGKFVQ
ncbi:hypothetical protein AMATHDRAFT_134949 [Amanita thiersii Skay4041]|uniref:Formamidopyrimidine-DNA glycosylase catalytic domain-containing protein n=1 Tax=Amanita thiersii Skay4041 TaxID=703135 RepID=A0A2A9P1R1_9AGAR|nr:hypothetical protein AMATHDRAFT_134949 [Amanita thiersii Skay4041]